MKFGKTIEDEAIPEWKSKYLDYDFLKGVIKKITTTHSSNFPSLSTIHEFLSSEDASEHELVRQLTEEENGFLHFLSSELAKVEEFYSSQLLEAYTRKDTLLAQLNHLEKSAATLTTSSGLPEKPLSATRPSFTNVGTVAKPKSVPNSRSNSFALPTAQQTPPPTAPSSASTENGQSDKPVLMNKLKNRIASTNKIVPSASSNTDNLLLEKRLSRRLSIKGNIYQFMSQKHLHLSKYQLQKAFVELYHTLELLKSFRNLNSTAYVKIAKKFMKHTQTKAQLKEKLMNDYYQLPFLYQKSNLLETLMKEIELLFQMNFTNGNRMKALHSLRGFSDHLPLLAFHKFIFPIYSNGIFTGINIMIFINILEYLINLDNPHGNIDGLGLIYFGLGFPVLLANLIAVNMYVWDQFKINFRMICHVKRETSTLEYASFVSFLATIYLGFVYLSLTESLDRYLSKLLQPWVLIAILLGVLVNFIQVYDQKSRLWFGNVMLRIFTTPYYSCEFKDFFLADQLASMAPLFQSIGYLLYFTFSGGDINTLQGTYPFTWYIVMLPIVPFYLRALQCIRRYIDGASYVQLMNCGRYTLGILVFIILGIFANSKLTSSSYDYSTFFRLVLALRLLYTGYSIYWDIVHDWGLSKGRMNILTKDIDTKLIIFPRAFYFFAITTNILARIAWLPIFISIEIYAMKIPYAFYILGLIELFRRFQWNFIRVEMEHVHNCERNKATSDVTLPFASTDLFVNEMEEDEEEHENEHEENNSNDKKSMKGNANEMKEEDKITPPESSYTSQQLDHLDGRLRLDSDDVDSRSRLNSDDVINLYESNLPKTRDVTIELPTEKAQELARSLPHTLSDEVQPFQQIE